MVDGWTVAAVIIPIILIPLLISEPGRDWIKAFVDCVKRILHPHGFECERLLWSDIPDGKLHDCSLTSGSGICTHWTVHPSTKRCYESNICQLFNRAWVNSARRAQMVQKPSNLNFGDEYILTDFNTLLAFVLCSVGDVRKSTWHDDVSEIHYDDTVLELERHDKILVAHVKGPLRPQRLTLTKSEIEKLLSGYPPFYRETLFLSNGEPLNFPIHQDGDIERAGWIIAIGLAPVEPLALFIAEADLDSDTEYSRKHGRLYWRAIDRVIEVLDKHIFPEFPENTHQRAQIINTIRDLQDAKDSGTTSGKRRTNSTPVQLGKQQAEMLIKIFNEFRPLESHEKCGITEILGCVLNVAVIGSFRVIDYLKNTGKRLRIPPIFTRTSPCTSISGRLRW